MPWLRKRIFSFGVIFALGFLLLVSMTLTTVLQVMFANVPSLLPAVGTAAGLAIYVVAFAFLYHYLPDRHVQWRQALLGGAITALLFTAGRYLIGLYIAWADPGSAYGSASALVIVLVWISRHRGVLRRRAANGGDRRARPGPGDAGGGQAAFARLLNNAHRPRPSAMPRATL